MEGNLRVSEQIVWSLVTRCQDAVKALKTDGLACSLNLSEEDSENERLHYRFVCMSNNVLLDRVITIKRGGCALKSEAYSYLFRGLGSYGALVAGCLLTRAGTYLLPDNPLLLQKLRIAY